MESRGDARYGLANYAAMGLDSEIYGCRPSTSLQQLSPRHMVNRQTKEGCYDNPQPTAMGLEQCPVGDMGEDSYVPMQAKKSPPGNGKKTKGRVKIKMEYIENKLRRYTTFSKRKTGIMKKAYELSTLTGTQVMLLVASETGHVYTFATRKLQPMITSEAGKALIQTCLNSPDPPGGGSAAGADQRMSATGFEETELTYNISDEDSKNENMSGVESSDTGSDAELNDEEPPLFVPEHSVFSAISPPASPFPKKEPSPTPKPSPTVPTPPKSTSATPQTSLLPPLVYQTPQGVMYATPSSGGVLLSLAQGGGDANARAQFITIPLSMVSGCNGQAAELDLSKRK